MTPHQHWSLLFIYSLCEHGLGKTAFKSAWGLAFWAIRKLKTGREKIVEKDIKVGDVGQVSLSFSGGKAVVSAQGGVDGGAVAVSASVSCDAGMLIDQLEAIVAKAVPASAPVDPAIFGVIKAAVLAIQ